MSNKALQNQRMRGFFIEAAIKIVEEEGVEAVTVRHVAEEAGYGYTTLYNYFANLNDLLWQTSLAIMSNLEATVVVLSESGANNPNCLLEMVLIYIDYMFDHPNTFRLFFMHEFDQHNGNYEIEPYEPVFPSIMNRLLNDFSNDGLIREVDIPVICESIIFSIHGVLTMSLSGRADVSRAAATKSIKAILNFHLGGNTL